MYSIFYQNLGRARSKLKDIYLSILINNYDIICLTETNFDSSVYDGESIDDRYHVFRRDRESSSSAKQSGGGVLVAIRNHINIIRQSSWESRVEDIWLTIMPHNSNEVSLHLCLCYLPPDLPLDDITAFHYNSQRVILDSTDGGDFLILGDFNTPNITWEKYSAVSAVLSPSNPQGRKAVMLLETMQT